MLTIFTIITALTSGAQAAALKVTIEGMSCVSCEAKVTTGLNALSFLTESEASTAAGLACATLEGELETAEVTQVITDLGYTLVSLETVDDCVPERTFPSNWADTEGFDVSIISLGEQVSLSENRAPNKFTIFDFGAPWCGPCHVAEKFLKLYLADHSDVAVRAIILNSQDANESYKMPVVSQHLLSAPGLPFFILMNPQGKIISKGVDLPKILKKLDRKR